MKRRFSSACYEADSRAKSPRSLSVSPKRTRLVANRTIRAMDTRAETPVMTCDEECTLTLTEGDLSSALSLVDSPDINKANSSIGRSPSTGTSPFPVNPSLESNVSGSPSTKQKKRIPRKPKEESVLNWRTCVDLKNAGDKKSTVNSATLQNMIEDAHPIIEEMKESRSSEQDVKKESGGLTSASNGDGTVVISRENSNDSASSDHSQPTIITNSTGSSPINQEDEIPKFGTKNNPVGDDVNMRMLGLPVSFGPLSRTVGKKKKEKDQDRGNSSSERGGMTRGGGAASLTNPPSASQELNWRTLTDLPKENGEATVTSFDKKEEEGCCVEEFASIGRRREDKILPKHTEEYIDSHCHLDYIWERHRFSDMDSLRGEFKEAFPATFRGCVANFIKPVNWNYIDWIKTVVKDGQVLGTSWGIHPHHSGEMDDASLQSYRQLVIDNREEFKIVAIGECGVDQSGKNDVSLDIQLKVFKFQVELAYELDLPIIIHCREGSKGDPEDHVLNVLKDRPNHPIHRHCFTRNASVAMKWMATLHDCSFGFTPAVTFYERTEHLRQLLNTIPLCRIHLETDAPYFKAGDYGIFRRPPCSLPGAAIAVAVRISEITGLTLDEILRHTRGCTERIYRIPRV